MQCPLSSPRRKRLGSRKVLNAAYCFNRSSRSFNTSGSLLRLSPGVDAHTHEFRKTGILDSKFGFPISTGQAEEAVAQAARAPGLDLLGYHCHIGADEKFHAGRGRIAQSEDRQRDRTGSRQRTGRPILDRLSV